MINLFKRFKNKDYFSAQKEINHEILKTEQRIIEEWENQVTASVLKDPDYQNIIKLIEENDIILLKHLESSKVLNDSLKSISEDLTEKYKSENPCKVDIENHKRITRMLEGDLVNRMKGLRASAKDLSDYSQLSIGNYTQPSINQTIFKNTFNEEQKSI